MNQLTHTFGRITLAAVALLLTLTTLAVNTTTAHAQSACPTPVNLQIGEGGRVIPGPPNIVRVAPGLDLRDIIGQISGGGTFEVLAGPACVDGYNWWRVTTGAITGWTADGDFREHWLEPTRANICAIALEPRLRLGEQARVTPGLPNIIREAPGARARLGSIPAGGVMDVLGGPACANGDQLWWYVNYNGTQGWTGEIDGSDYWLEPSNHIPTPTVCPLVPRLYGGISGMVTGGEPNTLRAVPDLQGERIGNITEYTTFAVIQGPVCNDGINWYQIRVGDDIAWTAEGQNGVYWLQPIVCGNGLRSRLAEGMVARVTPGLPNRLRSQPNVVTGAILDRILQGHTVRIGDGWACDANGRLWWQVTYNGTFGWTVEGDDGSYWLASN